MDCGYALDVVFGIVQDLAAAQELITGYDNAEKALINNIDLRVKKDRSFVVPAVGNVPARSKEFLQKCDHAATGLLNVVKSFYPNSLTDLILACGLLSGPERKRLLKCV